MAHLLILELPGGNDSDILEAAVKRGDEFTFLSAQLDHYTSQAKLQGIFALAKFTLDVSPFDYVEVERQILAIHATHPFDAILCLLDIRLIEASKLARALNLKFLNPQATALLRDKYKVRQKLAEAGLRQPDFELASSNEELKLAVERLGLPVLIKPVDGYGSQNIVVLRFPEDLDPLLTPLEDLLPMRADYGLGVLSNDRMLVERYMSGTIIGCDTLTVNGKHQLLGINEKIFFDAPSFAIRGGCFNPNQPGFLALENYVNSLLNAVEFDWGAAHIELILTADGPQLIEINPRLVGAKIPRLISYALGASVHSALIDTHLGLAGTVASSGAGRVAVTRWIVASTQGVLERIELPAWTDERICCVEILKMAGDPIRPPTENADRIGYVMVCSSTQEDAENLAEAYLSQCVCHFKPSDNEVEITIRDR